MLAVQDRSVKVIVGIADMKVSAKAGDTLITYALGSCLGIAIHDPISHVGGLLHIMLPDSSIDPAKAKVTPFMFVDTGFPKLIDECIRAGALKERMSIRVAGGACAHGNVEEDYFQIGKRNFVMLRKMLWQKGLLLKAYDVGGSQSRTMSLDIMSGEVRLKVGMTTRTL